MIKFFKNIRLDLMEKNYMDKYVKHPFGEILLVIIVLASCLISCTNTNERNRETRTQIAINTTKGRILVELYNETPKHRDNFIQLVNEGFYDSLLWHRAIDDFVIQTGDPNSKNAQPDQRLGAGGVDYLVPSEIIDTLFHKRGTLSAARGRNPEYSSSGSHFVITQRGPASDTTLARSKERSFEYSEGYVNEQLAYYHAFHADSNAAILESAKKAYQNQEWRLYRQLLDSIWSMVDAVEIPVYYKIPAAHKAYYIKYGGVPWNDQLYTVFGEVLSGMEVVDSIATTKTDEFDRPVEDIRILSMEIIK